MVSVRPPMPVGPDTRTCIARTSRPSSAAPASWEAPPVMMSPAGSMPCPARFISSLSSS